MRDTAVEMLADPTPQPLRSKIVWAKFRDNVRAAPIEILRRRAQEMCSTALDEVGEQHRDIRRRFGASENCSGLVDSLILEGLKHGDMIAFAYLPVAGVCYRLKREVWQRLPSRLALEAIRNGVARIPAKSLIAQSLESELDHRPLFALVNAEKALLKLRPPALAMLGQIAKAIIADHLADTTAKMRKPDFVTHVIRRHPGCSRQLAAHAWAKLAPARWKLPGRPRRA